MAISKYMHIDDSTKQGGQHEMGDWRGEEGDRNPGK